MTPWLPSCQPVVVEVVRGIALASVSTALACGGSGPSAVAPLDPTQPHYGKTYAEWAAAWVQWVYQWPETSACPDPVGDPTGGMCMFDQDPDSPVVFLTGDWGTFVQRTLCSIPAGKAIVLPVIVDFQDNGAVPLANVKTDDELRQSSIAQFQSIEDVQLSIDGQAVAPMAPYAIEAAPYTYTLPPEPNIFTCQGTPGVSGTYSGYTSGYFVLLPPLSPGAHRIELSASATAGTGAFALHVVYDPLTVQ